MSIVGGVVVGVLGLFVIYRFLFYFLIIASRVIATKTKIDVYSYFDYGKVHGKVELMKPRLNKSRGIHESLFAKHLHTRI